MNYIKNLLLWCIVSLVSFILCTIFLGHHHYYIIHFFIGVAIILMFGFVEVMKKDRMRKWLCLTCNEEVGNNEMCKCMRKYKQ